MDLCHKFSTGLQMFYDDVEAKKDLFDYYHDTNLILDVINGAEGHSLILFSDRSVLEVDSSNERIKLTPVPVEETQAFIEHILKGMPKNKTLDLLKLVSEEAAKRGVKLPPDLEKLMERMKTC